VVVPADQLAPKTSAVAVGCRRRALRRRYTAYAAVRAIDLAAGDTVAIAGAAGAVGPIGRAAWLSEPGHGPRHCRRVQRQVAVGPWRSTGQLRRQPAAPSVGRVADRPRRRLSNFFGGGYVELAVNDLGVAPQRVNSIIDFAAVEKFGVKSVGSAYAAEAGVWPNLQT